MKLYSSIKENRHHTAKIELSCIFTSGLLFEFQHISCMDTD